MNPQSVIVLDGNTRIALAIIRSLGLKGIKVFVGGPCKLSRGFYSRFCSGHFVYGPADTLAGMNNFILDQVKKIKPDVLIPVLNKTFTIIMENKSEYEKYTKTIPMPDYEKFKDISDKRELVRLSCQSDMPVPETYCPEGEDEIEDLSGNIRYPVLIKPRISAGGFGIKLVENSLDLNSAYRDVVNIKNVDMDDVFFCGDSPIIQEYVNGKTLTSLSYCDEGVVKAMYISMSLRNYPVDFGPGILHVSVHHDKVRDLSARFLNDLKWNGIIGMQFIVDRKDGMPKLIDVNPRFIGLLESAIAAGIDFPYILFKKTTGDEVGQSYSYEEGRKFRWILFGELFYLLESKNKVKTILEYMSFKNTKCEISLNDFMPHIVQALRLLKNREEVR